MTGVDPDAVAAAVTRGQPVSEQALVALLVGLHGLSEAEAREVIRSERILATDEDEILDEPCGARRYVDRRDDEGVAAVTDTPTCAVPTCRRIVRDAFVCPRCGGRLVDALLGTLEVDEKGRVANPPRRHGGVAEMLADLEVGVARESRLAAGSGAQASETPLAYGYVAAEATWHLGNVLGTWVRALCEERGVPVPLAVVAVTTWSRTNPRRSLPDSRQTALCAAFLAEHVETVRQDAGGGELVDEVLDAVALGRRAIDRPADRVFCGRCTHCTAARELLAAPGDVAVSCPSCGHSYSVRSRQDDLLEEVRGYVDTASAISGLLGETFGIAVTLVQISAWKRRGHLAARGERGGHDLLRVGDVIDLARWSTPRTPARPHEAAR